MSDFMSSAPTQEFPRIRDTAPPPAPIAAPTAPVDPLSAPTQEVPIVSGVSGYGQPPVGYGWQRQSAPVGRLGRWFGFLRNSPVWLAPVAVLLCFAGAASWVVATNPTDDLGPTTCAFKMATGFDCPGCGGTRAFYYVLTLNLPEAARNHAIAVFAVPFLVYLYLSWAVPKMAPGLRWRLPKFRLTPSMATYFMIAWGVFWVVRNLPWAPFTLLYV